MFTSYKLTCQNLGTTNTTNKLVLIFMPPHPYAGALSNDFVWRLTVCRVHREYLEYRWKTKIGTQVAHVTRDSDTTFKVKSSKVNLQGRGNIVADSRTSLIFINSLIFMAPTATGSKARWAPHA